MYQKLQENQISISLYQKNLPIHPQFIKKVNVLKVSTLALFTLKKQNSRELQNGRKIARNCRKCIVIAENTEIGREK